MRLAISMCAFFIIAISFAMKPDDVAGPDLKTDSTQTRTLILLRHAKSDKSNMTIPDITRPLEASGKLEAEEIGQYLADQKMHIDLIVSSPSVRTRQTLEIVCPKINFPIEQVMWDSSLYACSGAHLVDKIKSTDNKYKTVMFVGHNPSITSATNELQASAQYDEIKTCGLVAIDYNNTGWADLSKDLGVLRFYQKPK